LFIFERPSIFSRVAFLYSCSFVCSREEPEPLAFDELRLLDEPEAVRLPDELFLLEPLLRLVVPELRLDEPPDEPLELADDRRPEELRLDEPPDEPLELPDDLLDEPPDEPLELPDDLRPEELWLDDPRPDEPPERPREPLAEEPLLLDCVPPERLCSCEPP
jgi:hypothetical protein